MHIVECEADVDITLDNAMLICTNNNYSALTNGINVPKLIGVLRIKSGGYKAGISVAEISVLSISGVGKLYAYGGNCGAGIGGGSRKDGGTIIINNRNVTARGGGWAVAIGGGSGGTGASYARYDPS